MSIKVWTLLEQVGVFNSLDSKAIYNYAYKIATSQVFTFKQVARACFNPHQETVSYKQKEYIRGTKYPTDVIILCNRRDLCNSTEEYISHLIDKWLEKSNVRLVTIDERHVITECDLTEMYPDKFQQMSAEDTKARMCANIWAKALGWQFSAPLYREDRGIETMEHGTRVWRNLNSAQKTGELEVVVKINGIPYLSTKKKMYLDAPKVNALEEAKKVHTKYTSNPATYRSSHCVAHDYEVKEFFEFYKALYKNNMLEVALEEDYHICPHCGRPTYISPLAEERNCIHCGYEF